MSQPHPLQPITHMSNNCQVTPGATATTGDDEGQLSDAGDVPPSSKKRRTAVRARGRRGRGGR